MSDAPLIDDLQLAVYRVPTDQPEADGTLHWEATELVVVHLGAGAAHGMGYSYTAARPAAALISDMLADCVVGQDPMDIPALWQRVNDALRNAGRPGLGMMAIAAVDMALWDLKARLLDMPLWQLWGRARVSVPAYASGGFLTYSDQRLRQQIEGWMEQDFPAIKIKIGADARDAEHRMALARTVVGEDVELMADLNGACSGREALSLARRLRDYRVGWLEEPVSSDDLGTLAWLRGQVPAHTTIAAGEYGWDVRYFRRMLEAGAVDVLQADATRCGYTGFLHTAALCDAFGVPLSAHCAPAMHMPLALSVPRFAHQEYFHDHVRLESMLFETPLRLQGGRLVAEHCPGHGMQLRHADAERFRI